MENKFKILDYHAEHKDSVISFNGYHTFKVTHFVELASEAFKLKGLEVLRDFLSNVKKVGSLPLGCYPAELVDSGYPGELLSLNKKGWKKGKIRIKVVLEFCPDEPDIEETSNHLPIATNDLESPLEDIRKTLSQDNQ
jgi:hypothetical protein